MEALVIGGGFFGCAVALELARAGRRTTLVEKDADLLRRASFNNQARVHHGYHYPRSILTGLRSRVNFPRFVADYPDCIDRSFRHFYAVARRQSQVTPRQFETFCKRIGAPLLEAPDSVRALFDPALVEDVYEVEEPAFDAARLRERLRERLDEAKVNVRLGTAVTAVSPGPRAILSTGETLAPREIYNCSYSRLNELQAEPSPLRHELTELCIVEVPEALRRTAVTVMCGPFFSLMPFPALGAHSFSHVRYTPHCAWEEREGFVPPPAAPRASRFPHMWRDAARFLPLLSELRYVRSLWEVKTVLPQSDSDDSRPIFVRRSARIPQLVSIMGGKIDNVYDLPRELGLEERAA